MAKDEPGMERVYIANGQLQGEVIRTKLEAAGIPVLLKYESLGIVMGLTFDGLGEVEVWVPEEFGEEAIQLLEERDDQEDTEADDSGLAD